MIFANGYIAAAFITGGVILAAMTGYAILRLRNAERRLAAVESRGRRP